MKKSSLITVLLSTLVVLSCGQYGKKSNDAKPKNPSSDSGPMEGSAKILQGKIGDTDWKFVRGFAYVSPTRPDKISIGLYGEVGPTGCAVEGESVFHEFANDAIHPTTYVTLSLPRRAEIATFPWQDKSADVHMNVFKTTGEGFSDYAKDSQVEIFEITATSIKGSIKTSTYNGNVDGHFAVTFCKDSQN